MSDTSHDFTVVTNIDTASVSSPSMDSDNVLNKLKSAIQKKVERPVVEINIPERPGVSLQIAPNINQNQLRSWRKNAGEDSKNGMDTVKFACAVVAHTTIGILIDGEVAQSGHGENMNFASPEIMAMTNTSRPYPDCVKAFFVIEPHIEAAAVAIMEAAGYGDTVDAVDPTMKSSTTS
jgi:hypothetical protein